MIDSALQPTSVHVMVLRAPIAEPVRTSFGTMRDRPAVLVGIGDAEGRTGWGEIWCNFPACGAEHRANLLSSEIAPLLINQRFDHPKDCFDHLSASMRLLVNQTGEAGPIAQVIAGVDIALWDLYAQVTGVPLYQALRSDTNNDVTPPVVPVYASGLNPTQPEEKVREKMAAGYSAFKLKVGFDDTLDIRNAKAIRSLIGDDKQLMVDANQAWDLPRATRMTDALADVAPQWVEEPLPVDASETDWQTLSQTSAIPLAGGENLRGDYAFDKAIKSGIFGYIQPDIAKWGGLSGTLRVAQNVRNAGLTYCPHWLGGGIGLLASAHLLAATGGNGMLEVDANPNPLRDDLVLSLQQSDGDKDDQTQRWQPGPSAGLGIQLNEDILTKFKVFEWTST